MTKQEKTNPETPAFKLSGNNSLLTLSDGRKFELNVAGAMNNFLDEFPLDEITEIRQDMLITLEEFTRCVPAGYPMELYKQIFLKQHCYSAFFHAFFLEVKGGDHD